MIDSDAKNQELTARQAVGLACLCGFGAVLLAYLKWLKPPRAGYNALEIALYISPVAVMLGLNLFFAICAAKSSRHP